MAARPLPAKRGLVLHGQGFRLRSLTVSDLELLRNWRNRDDVRYGFFDSRLIAPEAQQAWYKSWREAPGDYIFIIELAQETAWRPVGAVSIYHLEPAAGQAEFGRLMLGEPTARGQGWARRAAALASGWAFRELEIGRLHLSVKPDNWPARRLYERLGFRPAAGEPPPGELLLELGAPPSED
ncbi:MAG: GNAT family N-acetyltransferase [Deltaproteobacteria bacterium]|nr:GNAT family N-acetyltransferase [Deltaproteobacteria bacterium]